MGHRFRTDPDELDTLWARLPKDAERIEVVMEPTRLGRAGGLVPPPRRDGGDGATRAVR